jgi:hypothetical protein
MKENKKMESPARLEFLLSSIIGKPGLGHEEWFL